MRVEQQEIVRRVEALFALAEQSRGELAAREPANEPAEKLLERIRIQSNKEA